MHVIIIITVTFILFINYCKDAREATGILYRAIWVRIPADPAHVALVPAFMGMGPSSRTKIEFYQIEFFHIEFYQSVSLCCLPECTLFFLGSRQGGSVKVA